MGLDIILSGDDAKNFIAHSRCPDEKKIAQRDRFIRFINENCTITDTGDCFTITAPDDFMDALEAMIQGN